MCTKSTFQLANFTEIIKLKSQSHLKMNVLAIQFNNEIKNMILVVVIIVSLFILYKLMQNKKKEGSKSTLLLAIISVLITVFLFYNFYKNYL